MVKIEARVEADGTVAAEINVSGTKGDIAKECTSIFLELPKALLEEDRELFHAMAGLFKDTVEGKVGRTILEEIKTQKGAN